MAYDKFNTLKSSAVPLPIENVDTDQIIPARFLKATEQEEDLSHFITLKHPYNRNIIFFLLRDGKESVIPQLEK